jgi:hypothetical protein
MAELNQHIHEIVDILDEEYYSIGIVSGHEALANLLSDFFDGHLDNFLEEQGSSKHEFHKIIFWVIAKKWIVEGKMWQAQDKWYELQRENN